MAKERESQGRVLQITNVGEFTLLNSEKLGRVLDLIEGITAPTGNESTILTQCKDLSYERKVLTMYDRLGGAIKMGERKVALGAFYDFAARAPIKKVEFSEKDYADEYVLVQKKTRKGKKAEDAASRIKRLEAKVKKAEPKEVEQGVKLEGNIEGKKRGRPKSNQA